MVDGKRVTELATEISDDDHVTVDGKPVVVRAGLVVAFHKPRGYVCTRSDERDRQTIYDLLPGKYQNLHHVGRLEQRQRRPAAADQPGRAHPPPHAPQRGRRERV